MENSSGSDVGNLFILEKMGILVFFREKFGIMERENKKEQFGICFLPKFQKLGEKKSEINLSRKIPKSCLDFAHPKSTFSYPKFPSKFLSLIWGFYP